MMQLIYTSNATHEMSEDALLSLLEEARTRNKKENITGMLIYAGGNFFQALEGEEATVDALYKRIEHDPRHNGCIVLDKKPIVERTFPQWSMGFKYLTRYDKTTIEGYSEFLGRKMAPEEFANKTNEVIELLYLFKKYN